MTNRLEQDLVCFLWTTIIELHSAEEKAKSRCFLVIRICLITGLYLTVILFSAFNYSTLVWFIDP